MHSSAGRARASLDGKAVTGRRVCVWLNLAAGFVLLALPIFAAAGANKNLLEFRGQVTLPANALSPRARLFITLFGVDSSFSGHTWADFKGRFQFRNLEPGSYTLSIYIPNDGQILQTLDITKSFSDSKGRVEKRLEFSEESLRSLVRSASQDTVSVRALSIPLKARGEYEKAQTLLQRHDADGAIQHLKKAVELAPQFAEALNYLGTIYFQRREYSSAERFFRQALEQNPQAYEPLVNLGGALLAQGRGREALAINLHAQNAQPKDALANAQLGLSYFLLGDYERAAAFLQLTKEIDPAHFSNPEIPLAEIYLQRSDNAAAVRELEDFLKVHPDSPQARNVRAVIQKIQSTQKIEQSHPVISIGPPPS